VILALFLMSGCGEVTPIGGRPDSDHFFTQDSLSRKVTPEASRESIQKQFGEPYVVSKDGNALAFFRSKTVERRILTMAVIVPFWSRASVTYFQIIGIWFGADGKVLRTRIWNGHDGPYGGNPYESYRVPSRQHTLLWLAE
jgi:hypothetical protein